jgi:hypothetical protein
MVLGVVQLHYGFGDVRLESLDRSSLALGVSSRRIRGKDTYVVSVGKVREGVEGLASCWDGECAS